MQKLMAKPHSHKNYPTLAICISSWYFISNWVFSCLTLCCNSWASFNLKNNILLLISWNGRKITQKTNFYLNKRLWRACIWFRQWIKQGLPMAPILGLNWNKMRMICWKPPIHQSYKVTIYWASYFQRRK